MATLPPARTPPSLLPNPPTHHPSNRPPRRSWSKGILIIFSFLFSYGVIDRLLQPSYQGRSLEAGLTSFLFTCAIFGSYVGQPSNPPPPLTATRSLRAVQLSPPPRGQHQQHPTRHATTPPPHHSTATTPTLRYAMGTGALNYRPLKRASKQMHECVQAGDSQINPTCPCYGWPPLSLPPSSPHATTTPPPPSAAALALTPLALVLVNHE